MSTPPPKPPTDSFLLGDMHATMRNIDTNVAAMRIEIGDLARRVTTGEQEMAALKAERATLMPEYQKFTHKVNNHIMVTDSLLNQVMGGAKAMRWALGVIGLVLLAGFTIIGNQVWNDHRQVTALGTRQAERIENQSDRRQERDDRYADRAQERANDAVR